MKTKLLKQLWRSKVTAEWNSRMKWWEITRICAAGWAHLHRTPNTDEALLYILRYNRRWRLARKYKNKLEARHTTPTSKELQ